MLRAGGRQRAVEFPAVACKHLDLVADVFLILGHDLERRCQSRRAYLKFIILLIAGECFFYRFRQSDDFTYEAVKVGDYVEQAIVDAAMDCVPPACMRADCSQMGEPYSARMDEKTGRWRDTYETFRKVGGEWPNGIWEYCGHCFRGENVERGKPIPCC